MRCGRSAVAAGGSHPGHRARSGRMALRARAAWAVAPAAVGPFGQVALGCRRSRAIPWAGSQTFGITQFFQSGGRRGKGDEHGE